MSIGRLDKNVLFIIAKFLTKNDIARFMATSKKIFYILKDHPKLLVYKVECNEYWSPMMEFIVNDYNHHYCIFIDYIDRGFQNFKDFAYALKEAYPNISELWFRQNYSYRDNGNRNIDVEVWEKEFVYFIKTLNLTYLKIEDSQSSFFSDFDWGKILDMMPDRSEYIITSNQYKCGRFDDTRDYFYVKVKNTKKLILHYH